MAEGFVFEGLDEFINKLDQASKGEFEKEFALFNDAAAIEFLDTVVDEIIRKRVVDTRLLLNSFDASKPNAKGSIHKKKDKGLTVEVGTNIEYAAFINDGHWTCKQGTQSRFVPGKWKGDKFEYIKGAKTGMILKQQWVEGYHFWESAVKIYKEIFGRSIEKKLQQWIDEYFGG